MSRLIIFLLLSPLFAVAQNRNNVWCFGDSAGIDFNVTTSPTPITTSLDSRGTCVSISDTNGNILFYANTRAVMAGFTTGRIWNKNHQLMQNGDSIAGNGWYHEYVIVPMPGNTNLYYLFSIGVTSVFWLKYCVIDMNLDSGLGAVTQKNIQLQSFEQVDCLNAIKHGNGRDWWLIFRKSDFSNGGANNDFYEYLITPTGISNVIIQSVGSDNPTNGGTMAFSPTGDKMTFVNINGLMEFYDFDRCAGIISNPITIYPTPINPPATQYSGCAFSASGNMLYVSTNDITSHLLQFDLNAPNIAASCDTLWSTTFPKYCGGALKRGPDEKIYFSCVYYNDVQFPYPYADTMYNQYNMNLGVINSPDSLGAACDFQPYSFYLGGKRTYWGLPNNPDYDMKPLYGSVCDSLSAGIATQPAAGGGVLHVTYITSWQKLFVNAEGLKGKNYVLRIFDLQGRNVFTQTGKIIPPYFTTAVECSNFLSGMYIVSLVTDKESLSKKFVKE